ncbi:MAG TPA: Hsp20/alpha crystallin family protein [Gemmatimonadales bacterium]|jgi:HSP20 family protein|nr:Hsp20/alpha crystallin family protein [Gemmatimonadales bacterium]
MFLTTADSVTLGNRISRLFTEALDGTATWVPAVDVLEQADAIRIMTELPGVRPEDVKISVEGNVLTIQGQKQQVAEEKTERVHRYERTYGAFERTFTLPPTVDSANIKAGYENGVLTVTLPKVEKAKPRQVQVEVAKS